jgi:hypothetical protein
MRNYGGTAMDLGHQSQVDREGQLYLLSFAQSKIFRFDEDAVRAQVLRFADPALASRHHHVDRCACAVAGVQATLHPDYPFALNS